ncbi:MAG: hypothetical protein Q9212_004433 [Teloschistes hypoglaucus]
MEGNAFPATPNPPQLRDMPPLSSKVKKSRDFRNAPPLSSNVKKSLRFHTRRIQGDGPSHKSRPKKSYKSMVTNSVRKPAKKATRSASRNVFSPDELRRTGETLRTLQKRLKKSQMEVAELQGSVAKVEKIFKNLCRLKRRAMEHEIRVNLLNQDGSASDSGRTEAWADDIVKHQQAARAAGLAWFRHHFDEEKWSERSTESKTVFAQAYGYFFVSLRRWQLNPAALAMIEKYDTLPMQRNSAELAGARVRMIREMIVQGKLAQEKTKGLMVTEQEASEALIGLSKTENGGHEHLLQGPGFHKLKAIDWSGVFNWRGKKLHKLPLRSGDGAGGAIAVQDQGGQHVGTTRDEGGMEIDLQDLELEDEDTVVSETEQSDEEDEESGGIEDERVVEAESQDEDEDENEEDGWKILEAKNNDPNFGVWEILSK